MPRYKFLGQVPALGVLGAEGGSHVWCLETLSFRCDPVALFVCMYEYKGNRGETQTNHFSRRMRSRRPSSAVPGSHHLRISLGGLEN